MGRKKNKPTKNIDKVVGAKVFKVKSKAKTVTSTLKKITTNTKSKIVEMDRNLQQMQDVVHNIVQDVPHVAKRQTLPANKVEVFEDHKSVNVTTDNLSQLQL